MKFVRHHKRQIRMDYMTKQPVDGSKPYTLNSSWHLLHSIRATKTGEEIALSMDNEFWPTADVQIIDVTKDRISAQQVCSRCYGMYRLLKESLDLEYEPD